MVNEMVVRMLAGSKIQLETNPVSRADQHRQQRSGGDFLESHFAGYRGISLYLVERAFPPSDFHRESVRIRTLDGRVEDENRLRVILEAIKSRILEFSARSNFPWCSPSSSPISWNPLPIPTPLLAVFGRLAEEVLPHVQRRTVGPAAVQSTDP